ncbi:MAG: glycosyl hydrolase 115 family protein [Gemmatimonadaceae bacterium]
MICGARPDGLAAQEWSAPVRGSWVAAPASDGDVVLANAGSGCEIVVADDENSAVKQAATFLAGDIYKISGYTPPIIAAPSGRRVAIRLTTLGSGEVPHGIARDSLNGKWEAYQVLTDHDAVWLVGSNFRGTAFAVYTLSERLGIDPLYLWTGYTPEKHSTLVLKKTSYRTGPPTFRYRGLFHDDEDILPRPFEASGYPLRIGDVPTEWYKRFFETALRLRLNMVAPYTRVHRRYEVQKTASDWGLFYTSHHYDILLSNPFGIERFGLGRERNAGSTWDWFTNRDGMLNYWRGGVIENRNLDAIWPVGLRGTDDHAYRFPEDVGEKEQARIFRDAIETQVGMTKALVPSGKHPIFQFTLYREMLDKYRTSHLDIPANVILVWPDDNDGTMLALPQTPGKWKHGVYYHLAYFGPGTKQVTHTVTPERVAREFRRIVDAHATEYMLLNVSELRDFAMATRMITDISWDATSALGSPDPSRRFVDWWSREYFGAAAAPDAARTYAYYYQLISSYDKLWCGADAFQEALDQLSERFTGKPYHALSTATVTALEQRDEQYDAAIKTVSHASDSMNREQRQYFFENAVLGLLIDRRPTQAVLKLAQALNEPDSARAWRLIADAMKPLEELEVEILRAERPPFDKWYRKTWIRRETKPSNVHRSYEQLRVFLTSGGRSKLAEPEGAARPDLSRFCLPGNNCSGRSMATPVK